MATEYYTFTGRARFAKVYEPDEFMGAKRYKIGLYPDEESMAEFVKSGIQKGIKEDVDGKYFEVTRDQTRTFGDVITKFSPPIVYDKVGSVIRAYVDSEGKAVRSWHLNIQEEPKAVGEKVLIGNGSEVAINVAVFDTRKGKGQRLETVKILDLIEYKKEEPVIVIEEPEAEAEAEAVAVKPKAKGKAPWGK